MTLFERQAQAKRMSDLYCAEWQGLLRAGYTAASIPFSSNPDEQAAFERGLREGRTIVEIEAALKAKSEPVTA